MGIAGPRSPQSRADARTFRRRRLVVAATTAALIALIGLIIAEGGGGSRSQSARRSPVLGKTGDPGHVALPARKPMPALEAGLLPWSLTAPLSRMVVLPGGGAGLIIAGGLNDAQATTSQVYRLDTTTGALTDAGSMASGVHDAAGALIGGQYVVFGGGSPNTVAGVQTLPVRPGGATAPGQQIGMLPTPRSDETAVSMGSTTYVVGGYDGAAPSAEVLSTSDGKRFQPVATLPTAVRYPAAAVAAGQLYLFGGRAVGAAGQALDLIQRVDPATHRATVVGHLPVTLESAAAFTLGGVIYVAGGDSSSAPSTVPGAGTTQLDGWATGAGQPSPGLSTLGTVWAFDPSTGRVLPAGQLQVPVSHAGVAVTGGRAWLIGGELNGRLVGTVQVATPNISFGTAGAAGAGSPYFGNELLIADRGNNRLLVMDPAMRLVWSYPNSTSPSNPLGFYFPDDAFFANHGTVIVSNQEQNETIVQIGYPSGQVVWAYGHPKASGTAPGYLHEPDDAYLLRDGRITVADADNCRVLVINSNGTLASQIGTNGVCRHHPPTSMGSPNGDTPLWDGNLLVSEINGSWVTEYTPAGQLVWTVHLPLAYPSDPQQLDASATNNNDRYLIADYSRPGQVVQFDREGQVLADYRVDSGPGMLDHPSLAERLPNGVYMINDDYNHRMVAIDSTTGALVWQYGLTTRAGSSPGMLNTPDGFDLLGPGGTTPTHPQTG